MHISCMLTMLMVVLMMSSSSSVRPLSPLQSPSSLIFHTEHVGAKEQPAAIEEEDYGNWNPTPYIGGGVGAPIPHGEV